MKAFDAPAAAALLCAACASSRVAHDGGADARGDAAIDARGEAAVDAAADSAPDAGLDAPPDVPSEAGADAGVCTTWRLEDAPAESVTLADPAPLNTERTVRVRLRSFLADSCHRRAMPEVTTDPARREVAVRLRVWVEQGVACLERGEIVDRYVTFRVASAGTWTVRDASGAAAPLAIDVGAPPPRPCGAGPGGACEMDCDCADGAPCLGGFGLGGPFTACAWSCESDMDCPSSWRCLTVPDGLEASCMSGDAACGGGRACPVGYRCADGGCVADFVLGAATRAACACDADCAQGLSCVRGGAEAARCEVRCETPSARWCHGPHFCGEAEQDIAGIAADDAVCVFVGE